jgi:hypothetical protein
MYKITLIYKKNIIKTGKSRTIVTYDCYVLEFPQFKGIAYNELSLEAMLTGDVARLHNVPNESVLVKESRYN